MKKTIKKQMAIIALVMIILSVINPTITCAATEMSIFAINKKSNAFLKWENLSEEERKNAIEPTYFSIDAKDSVKRSKYNQQLKSTTTEEKRFSLKDVLNNIIVKDQKRTGACWAFSYSSVIETTLANKYNIESREYSPIHMDYMTGKIFNRKVGDGGTYFMELGYSASGLGPVYEDDLPFDSVYDENNNSSAKYYLDDISEVNLEQVSRARVEDVKIFADINKNYLTNSITYIAGDGTTEYSLEEVKALRNLVKSHIKENGAVQALFYSDMGIVSTGEIVSEEGFWNAETSAYYCNDSSKTPNHSVTIIGWDDEYSKNNFAEGKKPLNDGAYIVLNSWGSEFGEDGYYYVSYDDAIIEQGILGITEITEKENSQTKFYDNIYEYDELGISQELMWGTTSLYAANVFDRVNIDEKEYLTEVGVFLGRTQGVEVYLNAVDDNIQNCTTLIASYTETNALEPGYHTLKLASPIELTGTKFTIMVKYINLEGASIPFECDLKESGFAYMSTAYDTATSNQGESFISLDGEEWHDIYNLKVGLTNTLKDTNVCIKGFTTLSDAPLTIGTTGVTLDKRTVILKEGETISLVATVLPENATNKNIIWTSNNENVATVANGVITGMAEGTATITVTTEDGNFTDTCIVTVEKVEGVQETIIVTGVTLDKKTVILKEGETTSLVATVLPENATNKNITWTSNNESVATVTNGIITGIAKGLATITVTTEDGNFTDTCIVSVEKVEVVPETIAVTGVTLDKEIVTLKEGETTNLVATVLPENATNKNITWTSSNENVAIVANGVITGIAEGVATITVTTTEGDFIDNCTVTVEKEVLTVKVTEIELNKTELNMQIGNKTNLVATIKPTNATNKNVIWTSSNTEVAIISENGIIEALKQGKTTITVQTQDGNFTAKCEVTVSEKTNTDDDIYTESEKEPGKIEGAGDSTTAKGEIPKAGIKTIMTVVFTFAIVSVVVYKKYKTFEDIK